MPIRKPWAIATDCPSLVQASSGKRCPGKQAHPEHAPWQGCDTAASGFYTRPLCALVHKAWQRHVLQRERSQAALVGDWSARDSLAVQEQQRQQQQDNDSIDATKQQEQQPQQNLIASADVPCSLGDGGSRPGGSGLGVRPNNARICGACLDTPPVFPRNGSGSPPRRLCSRQ